MSAVQKLCCVCGKDVASAKRVKDQRGRYYCQICAANARQAAPAAAAANPVPAPAPAPEPPANDLDLAPVQDHAPQDAPKAACSRCKKLLPERQVRCIDGEFVCNACASQAAAPKRAAKSKSQTAQGSNQKRKFTSTLLGRVIIFAIILALVCGAFFLLYPTYLKPAS